MASFLNANLRFGKSERILAVLFGVGLIVGFLLTPLVFETRMNELRTPLFAAFFIVVGLLTPIAGLVLLFRKPGVAGVLAVINAVVLFFVAPAEQASFFFTVPPPLAVTVGEYILILVGIGYMLCGPQVYVKNRTIRAKASSSAANEQTTKALLL